jgi:hypothetical protein
MGARERHPPSLKVQAASIFKGWCAVDSVAYRQVFSPHTHMLSTNRTRTGRAVNARSHRAIRTYECGREPPKAGTASSTRGDTCTTRLPHAMHR